MRSSPHQVVLPPRSSGARHRLEIACELVIQRGRVPRFSYADQLPPLEQALRGTALKHHGPNRPLVPVRRKRFYAERRGHDNPARRTRIPTGCAIPFDCGA